jgi:polyisoprenoid-binding protein YceI
MRTPATPFLAAACFAASLLAGLLLLPPRLQAAGVAGRWAVRSGTIAYEVSHVLHSALGRSKEVQGTLDCEAQRCRFEFHVPLASFDSRDADRDRDMRAVLDAPRFPTAEVRGSGILVGEDEAVVEGSVTLAGATVALPPTRFRVERGWWRLRVRGSFALSLEAFGIQRPALMGIHISDALVVYVNLELGSA